VGDPAFFAGAAFLTTFPPGALVAPLVVAAMLWCRPLERRVPAKGAAL